MGMKSSERISYSVEYLSYGIFLGAAFGIILGSMLGRDLGVSMLAGTVFGIMLGFMLGSVKDKRQHRTIFVRCCRNKKEKEEID